MTRILGDALILVHKGLISKVSIVLRIVCKVLINTIMLVLNRLHKELIANTQIQNNYISAMIVLPDVTHVQIIFKILARVVNPDFIIITTNV